MNAQVVKYQKFEVLCKSGTIKKYREGKIGSIDNVILTDDIYTNSSKGDKAKNSDLVAAFGTDKVMDCIKVILDKGEFALTVAEKKEMVDQKRKEVINYIHKYFVDPKTNYPHPVTRIENTFQELKIVIDPFIPAERQFLDIHKKLLGKLTLKKVTMDATITIPSKFLGKCKGLIQEKGTVSSEKFGADGSADLSVTLAPGDFETLVVLLDKVTGGSANIVVDNGILPSVSSKKGKK